MSQWMRDTSTPNSAIALAPIEPTIPSSSGAAGVQGPADAVVVEDFGLEAEHFFGRPRPVPSPPHGQAGWARSAGLATKVSITWPWAA